MKDKYFWIRLSATLAMTAVILTAGCGPVVPQGGAQNPTNFPEEKPAPTPTLINLNTTDPDLLPQVMKEAESQAAAFSEAHKIQIDASKAVGLDAGWVGGDPKKLASIMAPATDSQQTFTYQGKPRQVLGLLSVNDDSIVKQTELPQGAYVIACDLEAKDCLAVPVPAQGEPIPINSEMIEIINLPAEVKSPIASYEQGSIRACFYIYDSVKVCIKLF